MFWHLYKYRLISLVKTVEITFWTAAFPLILATMFYFSIGNVMVEGGEFEALPVAAVIEEGSKTEFFERVLDMVGKEGKEQFMTVTKTTKEEAQALLRDKEVEGILYAKDTLSLEVTEEGVEQSILKYFLEQCLQNEKMITEIIEKDPSKVSVIVDSFGKEVSFTTQGSLSDGNLSSLSQYFYALIAMACLYGCFGGLECVLGIQANLKTLAARKCIAPVHKLTILLADFFATVTLQFGSLILLLIYLIGVLKLELGNQIGFMLLTTLVGAIIGVANGTFIGALGHWKENTKSGILICITMLACVLSGLMNANIKNMVEQSVSIINRINPATLLSDCYYSLNVYDNYDRFTKDIVILVAIASILCIASYLILRREKYANL